MADLASLAIKVDNADVPRATTSLNAMTVAGGKTEAATQRLTRRMALLEIEARSVDAAMGKNRGTLAGLATSMGLSESAAGKLSKSFGVVGAIAAVGFIGHKLIAETIEAQNAMAQLEAAVQSTGGVAGRTVDQLDDLSMAMQRTTTYSDEAVKGAESMLLTFDKIRGTQFDQATQAVADLAARMGGDLQGAAVQVGKALQDPTTGLTALRRSGVSFSESQIALIKTLYDTNRVAEGQAIILKELEHQFGGSAAAARNTLGGSLTYLKNTFGDLFEVSKGGSASMVAAINAIGDAMPAVGTAIGTFVTNTIVGYNNMSAAVQKFNNIMSVDLSHGIGAYAAEVKRLNALVEEERLGANAMAVTHVAAAAATRQAAAATSEMSKEERDRIKKQREAAEDMVREAQQAFELAGLEGHAQEELRIVYEAMNKAIKARREEHHELLPETLKAIEAEEHWKLATEARSVALKAENLAIKEAADAAEGFVEDLSTKMAKSLSGIFGKDNPLRGFFEELTHDLLRMWLANFIAPALLAARGLTATSDLNDIADASKSLGGSPWIKRGAAGLAGLGIGYGIGSAMGNTATGVLGGAAGGALAGAQIAGPWGAAIGGLVGAAGGLLGAASAHRAAAQALKDSADAFRNTAESYITGSYGNDQASRVLAENQRFEALANELMVQISNHAFAKNDQENMRLGNDEYHDLIAAHKRYLDAINKTTDALGELSNMLNVPTGIRVKLAQFNATTPVTRSMASGGTDAPIIIQLDGKTIARSTLKNLRKMSSEQFGTTQRFGEVV